MSHSLVSSSLSDAGYIDDNTLLSIITPDRSVRISRKVFCAFNCEVKVSCIALKVKNGMVI